MDMHGSILIRAWICTGETRLGREMRSKLAFEMAARRMPSEPQGNSKWLLELALEPQGRLKWQFELASEPQALSK